MSSALWLHPGVNAIVPDGDVLYIGGGFGAIGNVPASSLAAISFGPAGPDPVPVPERTTVAMLRPNPVNASATIRYAVPTTGPVSLAVFDIQGRRVATLLDHQVRVAGWHEEPVHAETWPRGLYFCRLEVAGRESAIRKFVVLRWRRPEPAPSRATNRSITCRTLALTARRPARHRPPLRRATASYPPTSARRRAPPAGGAPLVPGAAPGANGPSRSA